MVLTVTLLDVLSQGAVSRQEGRRYVDWFGVPYFAVFHAEVIVLHHSQETQFSPDTEVRHYNVKSFFEHGIFVYFFANLLLN